MWPLLYAWDNMITIHSRAFLVSNQVAQAHLVCKAACDLLVKAGMPAMHSGSLRGSPRARLRASPPATPVLLGGE